MIDECRYGTQFIKFHHGGVQWRCNYQAYQGCFDTELSWLIRCLKLCILDLEFQPVCLQDLSHTMAWQMRSAWSSVLSWGWTEHLGQQCNWLRRTTPVVRSRVSCCWGMSLLSLSTRIKSYLRRKHVTSTPFQNNLNVYQCWIMSNSWSVTHSRSDIHRHPSTSSSTLHWIRFLPTDPYSDSASSLAASLLFWALRKAQVRVPQVVLL